MLLLRTVFNILVRNASLRGPMCFRCLIFSFSGPCDLFYCLLDLRSGECDVVSLYFMCSSVSVPVCLVCCVFDSVYELFGETTYNMFGCVCYFVVECSGVVKCGWRCSIG